MSRGPALTMRLGLLKKLVINRKTHVDKVKTKTKAKWPAIIHISRFRMASIKNSQSRIFLPSLCMVIPKVRIIGMGLLLFIKLAKLMFIR